MLSKITLAKRRYLEQFAPSNLTGANGFAGQDHCSRVCGAEHRRAAGAPLTVILNGKESSAPLDGLPALVG